MDLYVLIFGLCLCALTTGIFLNLRVNKGGVGALMAKTIASLCFVIFALFLSATKVGVAYDASLTVTCLIVGLVCGLIGDILLDLKVMYAFHENKYLAGGMTAFSVGHIFNILGLLLLANNEVNIFSGEYLLPLAIVVGVCIILTITISLVSKKALKFEYGKFGGLVNLYTFILLLTTALSIYFCFIGLSSPLFILAIGFVLFLASDLVLSMQYFGGKKTDKTLTFVNHLLYYAAQIVIAMFIYFI